MGNAVLVHLDRRCVVERMGCGISHLPSGTAGQDLLLGSVYPHVCVCVRACASWCGHVGRVYVLLGVVWVCAWLCLDLHTDGEDRDLAVIIQQHTAPPRGQLCMGTRMVWCEPPRRNLSLSSAGLHQAGIWPCCPRWGLRRGLVWG